MTRKVDYGGIMICLIQTWNKAVKIAIWCCFLAQLNGTESWNLPSGYVFLDANELHCNVELTFYCAKYNLKIAISWCFLAQMNGSESWNLHSGYVFLDWYELHRNVEWTFSVPSIINLQVATGTTSGCNLI